MRPTWQWLGVAWLSVAVASSTAPGQDWKADRVDLKGHSNDVVAEAISLDGKTLATASADGLAKVWDLGDTLKHRVDLTGHDGKVLSIAISNDGKLVATGGADRTVRLWDAVKGELLATLQGHSGAVEALVFSPDGKLIASSGSDTAIKLWDQAGRRVLRTLQGHEHGVRGLAFSPDGKLIASASRDHSVKLWDVAQGKEQGTLGRHDAAAWTVAFAPDGKSVASGGLDNSVRLWRVGPANAGPPPGQPQQQAQPQQDQARVIERQVRELEELRADTLVTRRAIPQEPGGAVRAGEVVVEQLVPGGLGGEQPQTNQIQLVQFAGDVVSVAFSPDGNQLAAAISEIGASRTTPGMVVFIQIPNPNPNPNQPQVARTNIRGHISPIWRVAFGPEGKTVVTVGGDASVRVWDGFTAKPLAISIGAREPEPIERRVMVHLDPVEGLAISPDGKTVVTATESAGVSLWNTTDRTLIGRLRDPAGPVRALAISPDGKTLATGGDGKAVSLWDATTGLPIEKLKGHLGAISSLAFSPDGKILASGSKDASVTFWDVAKKVEIVTLARHTSAVTCLAFSPDGKMLATGALDCTVKLWDVPSGEYRDTFDAHKDVVDALAFSPDGFTLGSGDRTGTIRLWDVARRTERLGFQALTGPVRALAFAPDGKTLIGGGDDQSIRRWDQLDGKVVALRSQAHLGPIKALAFGPGGKFLATAGSDRELKLWDVEARLAPGRFANLEGKVSQVVASPDGKTLATASSDSLVKLWDLASGRERTPPISFQGNAIRLAFSPDGQTLATLPNQQGVDQAKLWDVATGQMRPESERPSNQNCWAIVFAPDGKSWAITEESIVHLWGTATSRQLRDFEGATGVLQSVAFSPDGQVLAAASDNGSVTVWDLAENKKPRAVFRPSKKALASLAFSPDGKTIAVGGLDRVVHLLDATGQVRLTLRGPRTAIASLAFSPDGKTIASASNEPTLFVWDAAEGNVVSNPTLLDASAGEGLGCLAFSPDGKALYAGGDRGVSTFDMTPERRPHALVRPPGSRLEQARATLRGHADNVRSLIFLEGGSKLLTRSEDGIVKVWDLLDNNRDRLTLGGGALKIRAMAPSPDGKTLAVGLRPPPRPEPTTVEKVPPQEAEAEAPAKAAEPKPYDEMKVFSLDKGEDRGTITGKAVTPINNNNNNGMRDLVVALAYPTDGKTLATASRMGLVKLWDAASLAPGLELEKRAEGVDVVQFSGDGRTLLAANASGQVTLWDVSTGKILASFTHDGGMNQVLFSPDGKLVATGGIKLANPNVTEAPPESAADPGGDVRLWDSATGRRVAVLPMPSGKVVRIAFSPDGKSLAASTVAPVVTVWDVASAVPVVTLAWPSGAARYLAYSPDGKALATVGDDETLRVWDIPAGTLRADLAGHADAINWVAFSPDGKTLATASKDATVKLWNVPPARAGVATRP